jgi:uncharacterized protein (TIGR03382 family)
LGSEEPVIGTTGMTNGDWVDGARLFSFLERPVYAVSDVLVVVREPGTAVLLAMGLLALGGLRRRNV